MLICSNSITVQGSYIHTKDTYVCMYVSVIACYFFGVKLLLYPRQCVGGSSKKLPHTGVKHAKHITQDLRTPWKKQWLFQILCMCVRMMIARAVMYVAYQTNTMYCSSCNAVSIFAIYVYTEQQLVKISAITLSAYNVFFNPHASIFFSSQLVVNLWSSTLQEGHRYV